MTQKNEVATSPLFKFEDNLQKLLSKGIKALPATVNSDRLKLNALMYIGQDQKLFELAQKQPSRIAQIVYNFIALDLDMMNKECYIIPFGDTPTVVRDYKGEEKLAKKYSVKPISTIYSRVVCQNDETGFDDDGDFFHKYSPFDSDEKRGKRIGAYCKVNYEDGSNDIEFVNLDEIARVKKVSKTANKPDSIWNIWEESMFRKTAVKKMMKRIPLNFGKYDIVEKAFKESDNDVEFNRENKEPVIEQPDIIDVDFNEQPELSIY